MTLATDLWIENSCTGTTRWTPGGCITCFMIDRSWGEEAAILVLPNSFHHCPIHFIMRLLNVETLEIIFRKDEQYAILSHTWGDEEVTFEEFSTEAAKAKAGYKKIIQTCEQAKKDGYQYVWIDTCLIDKRSSAELSESINSMFQWYRDSQICYVYLEDVNEITELFAARWFRRGWTLQELLAPSAALYFNRHWRAIGVKSDSTIISMISVATGIDENALQGASSLEYIQQLSISTRMSWASVRQTTREEDMAYCLFGLFDVNMPLLYGEGGEKAFRRLQEEIMKQSTDHSILAWEVPSHTIDDTTSSEVLARHPVDFVNSGKIISTQLQLHPFSMNNNGLEMTSIPIHRRKNSRNRFIAVLSCFKDGLNDYIGIPVRSLQRDNKVFVREASTIESLTSFDIERARKRNICILRSAPKRKNATLWVQHDDLAFSCRITAYGASSGHWNSSSRTVEILKAQESQYYWVVVENTHTTPPLRLAVLVVFKSGERYTAGIEIRDLKDAEDMTFTIGNTQEWIKKAARLYEVSTYNGPQAIQFEASISWTHIAGQDVLALDIQVVDPSYYTWLKHKYNLTRLGLNHYFFARQRVLFLISSVGNIMFIHLVSAFRKGNLWSVFPIYHGIASLLLSGLLLECISVILDSISSLDLSRTWDWTLAGVTFCILTTGIAIFEPLKAAPVLAVGFLSVWMISARLMRPFTFTDYGDVDNR